jgi:DNA-directed RNA polymerase specialized sigma24 family protein
MNHLSSKLGANQDDRIVKRLDALIRLTLEQLYSEESSEFNKTTAAQLLNSMGFGPAEIAHIFGKKREEITSMLAKAKKRLKKSEWRQQED